MTGEPPLLPSTVFTVMVPSPDTSAMVGADGADAGAMTTGVDAAEAPTLLTARISTG